MRSSAAGTVAAVPRAVVLLNARARAGGRPPIGRVLAGFRAAGWESEVWAGDGSAWTTEAAHRAVRLGVAALFGAGGDGVLSDMLPAVLGTSVPLGVVPLGTGNVWARELGLPLDPERAIAAQLSRPANPVDVGVANGRPFLVIASVGFDAQIVNLVEASIKGLGQFAYPLAGVSLAAAVRGTRCRVALDEQPPREVELLACQVVNGRLYGGLVPLVPHAAVHDGRLDAVLFLGGGPVEAAAHVARVLSGTHLNDPNVIVGHVTRLRIESLGDPLPLQTDGDPRGTTPLQVEVAPGALLALGAPAR